jgi:hypothetical protein
MNTFKKTFFAIALTALGATALTTRAFAGCEEQSYGSSESSPSYNPDNGYGHSSYGYGHPDHYEHRSYEQPSYQQPSYEHPSYERSY